jgi:hypothetical protein
MAMESLVSDFPIRKGAGLFDELGFSGIASSIVNKVKGLLVEDDSPTGWLKAIGNLLVSGALFKLHPALGIVYVVAQALGVDIIGIGKKVLNGVYDAVKGGANLVMSDVDRQGKIAIGMYNKGLLKEAQLFRRRRRNEIDIPFLPRKGSSKIERVFGNLLRVGKKGKLKTLLVAIVIWTLKTALLGAGLVGAAGLIKGFISGDKKKPEKEEAEPEREEAPEETTVEPETSLDKLLEKERAPAGLTPSGLGTDVYENDRTKYIWMEPVDGSLRDMLVGWATDIYPELSGYEGIIYSSPAFLRVLNKFRRTYTPGESHVLVPKEFKSQKQVVDTFAGDVSKKIKEMK